MVYLLPKPIKDNYIIKLLPLHTEKPVHYNQPDTDDLKSSRYSNLAMTDRYRQLAEEPYAEVKLSINTAFNDPAISEQQSIYLNMTSQYLPLPREQQLKTENGTYFTENAENCKFEETFGENLRYIQSYKLDEALPYMEKLQLYSDPVPNNLSHKELQGTFI